MTEENHLVDRLRRNQFDILVERGGLTMPTNEMRKEFSPSHILQLNVHRLGTLIHNRVMSTFHSRFQFGGLP